MIRGSALRSRRPLSAPQAYALGHRLREAREEQGLTRGQAAYARALGTRITVPRARIRRS